MSNKHLQMKPATMEGVRAANSILEETMAKMGFNIDGTPKKDAVVDPSQSEFVKTLNTQFPGIIRQDGSIDIYRIIQGQTGDIDIDTIKQLNEAPIREHYAEGLVKITLAPESRCASHSLMTAEDSPKAMERELQARKANLLKGMDNGKS